MKTHITDALQVVAAIVITGGMVASAAPLPKQHPISNSAIVQSKPAETPVEAPKIAPAPEKVVTWQDNPNGCTAAQYIAQDEPFNCIDKAVEPVVASPVPSVVAGCGDNFYAQYIYQHESGCNLSAVNSIGCRGIGQACPGSKLPCAADYACQNAWFSNYAMQRYGSWEAAYYFWLNNHWW